MDYTDYASELAERFSNPSIAHRTFQIASDGTEKLPQRIFQPAMEALESDKDVRPFAFATAMWMRFCLQRHDDGGSYELHDPRSAEIAQLVKGNGHNSSLLSDAIHSLPDLIPHKLRLNDAWRESVTDVLTIALNDGCVAAVRREAEMSCGM